MPFEFENVEIDSNIITHSVFNVEKMPDMFLEVDFQYPRCRLWKTCVPIYEKYQGIDFTKATLEDVKDWICQCYDEMNPEKYKTWENKEKKYWESRPKAGQAKVLFEALNHEDRYHLTDWSCRQCTDTSKVNSQAGSRIRALKEAHGYHIASKDMLCEVCGKMTKHDLLLRIERKVGNAKKRSAMPSSIKKRTKELYDYTDVCFDKKFSKATQALIVDHKFPATRWAAGETPNYIGMSDQEILNKFQLLTNQTNMQKDRYCARCYAEKIRGDFFGIKWYPVGNDHWQGANNSDENGCIGCPWYDMKKWKQQFNAYLESKKE